MLGKINWIYDCNNNFDLFDGRNDTGHRREPLYIPLLGTGLL